MPPARELSRGPHTRAVEVRRPTGLQRADPQRVGFLSYCSLVIVQATMGTVCGTRRGGLDSILYPDRTFTGALPPARVISIIRLGWPRGEKLHRARCKTFSRATGVARVYLCAQRCVALTETNLRAPPGSARTIQVVPTVFFCPPASPPALQKENRFTTCLLGRPVLVSPPDVLGIAKRIE